MSIHYVNVQLIMKSNVIQIDVVLPSDLYINSRIMILKLELAIKV